MNTALIALASILAISSIAAILAYVGITSAAKANPDHWQHD